MIVFDYNWNLGYYEVSFIGIGNQLLDTRIADMEFVKELICDMDIPMRFPNAGTEKNTYEKIEMRIFL